MDGGGVGNGTPPRRVARRVGEVAVVNEVVEQLKALDRRTGIERTLAIGELRPVGGSPANGGRSSPSRRVVRSAVGGPRSFVASASAPGEASRPDPTTETRSALLALAPALDTIAPPAFVLDECGRILSRNASAKTLLARGAKSVEGSLVAAVNGGDENLEWDLIPLRADDSSLGFLAVVSAPSPRPDLAAAVGKVTVRWKLTGRQRQVLDLVAQGFTNAEIAQTLGIRENTVEFHVACIFDKAGVENRATLIARVSRPSWKP